MTSQEIHNFGEFDKKTFQRKSFVLYFYKFHIAP